MKFLFFGGHGQVGTAYHAYFSSRGHEIHRPELDIRHPWALAREIERIKPEVVINFVAQANIDICEENKLTAFDVNTLGADIVAKACQEAKVYLVHISTGCIQESADEFQAHKEEDQVTPLCFYAWTKYWGEELLMHRARRYGMKLLVLRPRQLLSSELSTRNALTKMLSYSKFIDTPNSCTVVDDLVRVSEELILRNVTGVYNVANPGITSPYKIAHVLRELINPTMRIEKITKEELNRMTKSERIDSVLDCSKLASLGIQLEPVDKRLREVVSELKRKLDSTEGTALMEKVRKETEWKLSLKTS